MLLISEVRAKKLRNLVEAWLAFYEQPTSKDIENFTTHLLDKLDYVEIIYLVDILQEKQSQVS